MKFLLTSLLVILIQAQENIENNEVNTDLTCKLDSECNYQDLQYITGIGKPLSNLDVCCATFPHFDPNDSTKILLPTYCYSKKILGGYGGMNMYS